MGQLRFNHMELTFPAGTLTEEFRREVDTVFVDILGASLFPGPVYDGYGHMIAERRYAPPGFDIRLGRKDLRLAQEAADAQGVELAALPTLVDAFEGALGGGLDGLDWAAIAEITRARSGAAPLPPQAD